MYFDSWSAVLQMEGHGPYVWAAYAITGLVVVLLVWTPLRRARRLREALRSEARRQAAQEGSHASQA